MHTLANPSARMALAGYLHDLGKLAERAGISVEKDSLATHQQLYCPRKHLEKHWHYTHKHAAYTALAMDLLEPWLPPLKGINLTPFSNWNEREADNSLVNASAMHHKPETFLQWVIATADRVASGFEREAFENYNSSQETPNHYRARLLSLFEQIQPQAIVASTRTQPQVGELKYCYPLQPLSPSSIFPQPAAETEPETNKAAQAEYKKLWDGVLADLQKIPDSHRKDLTLWLDHFDSLWLTWTQAIPAATAFGTRPEVSLYDHSRTTAALATALWRYHEETEQTDAQAASALKTRQDWGEEKLLLVQGDFQGIQNFIFASHEASSIQKKAAKLLRGRSFQVSLLCEAAALKVLEALGLPATSQVMNAAGKFLILAPNTSATHATIDSLQQEMDEWSLEMTLGQSGVVLATTPASCNDFLVRSQSASGFEELMQRIFLQLDQAKTRRLGLCSKKPPPTVFTDQLTAYTSERGACQVNGRLPAEVEEQGLHLSKLVSDQIQLGQKLADPKRQRLLLTRTPLSKAQFHLPLFGYWLHFAQDEEVDGRFGNLVSQKQLARCYDLSLPDTDPLQPLFQGYARRLVNAYVPLVQREDFDLAQLGLYDGLEEGCGQLGELKTFEQLARQGLKPSPDSDRYFEGVEALLVVKGDIDNLGLLFQNGLKPATFAKMASLSRQVNHFFALYLPWLCQSDPAFRDTYTVFAGGDDFFFIGPWWQQLQLVARLKKDFTRYVANNSQIHFSLGLHLVKGGTPVRFLADAGEQALEAAKHYCPPGQEDQPPAKNAVTLLGKTLTNPAFDDLWRFVQQLQHWQDELQLSTAYRYGLLELASQALQAQHNPQQVGAHLWRSRFVYRTERMLNDLPQFKALDKTERQNTINGYRDALLQSLGVAFAQANDQATLALQLHNYHQRKTRIAL